MAHFRDSLILINYALDANATEMFRVYSNGTYVLLANAPDCKFACEYDGRLWASGDNTNPKRLYFSGDRDPTTWVVPEFGLDIDESTMTNAGYFDILSEKGARVTSINSKFYGTLLAGTESSMRAFSGSSPLSYTQKVLSGELGTSGSSSGAAGLNDYICLNKNGLTSVVTTDKFGDLASERKSRKIGSLFNVHRAIKESINYNMMYRSILVFNVNTSTLLMAVPGPGSSYANKLYICYFPEEQWFGPFDEDIRCMAIAYAGYPITEYVLIGDSNGHVKLMRYDYPEGSEAIVSTSNLDGRSLDPSISSVAKTWKHIRVICNPTGNWPITIRWKTDSGAWKSFTHAKLAGKGHSVTGLSVTGTAAASDPGEKLVLETPIDARGVSLKVEARSRAPKLSVAAIEIDFHVSGYEKEN
jgi:hypothetical protein